MLAAVGQKAAAAANSGIVEQQVDVIGRLLLRHLVAKPQHLIFQRHVAQIVVIRKPLRQLLGLAQPLPVSAMFSAETSHMATLQPSATSCRTSSRPMPVPPPVTTAIFPAKSFIDVPFRGHVCRRLCPHCQDP